MEERILKLDPITRAECAAQRRREREEYCDGIKSVIGNAGGEEMKLLMKCYDERILEWLANLWDPEIGGFYFSNSARDTEGYLPDIESTAQAANYLLNTNVIKGSKKSFPQKMKEGLLSFAKSLQDPEDGFFYHPQWGKNVSISRRGRDLSWSLDIIGSLGGTPNYPTPITRAESKETTTLPPHLCSTDAFCEYLEAMDLATDSYSIGNLLQSQTIQIKAAGTEYSDILFDWLERNQRPDNGVWQEAVNYHGANGLMKICLMYSAFKRPLPHAARAMEYSVNVAMSDTFIYFCCQFYNPLVNLSILLDSLKQSGDAAAYDSAYAKLIELAPGLIKRTREKVMTCKREDGSFSYNYDATSYTSQGAPVALYGAVEGDVNGTCISSFGTVSRLAKALGVPSPPIYCQKDADAFLDLIARAEQKKKINPKPSDLYFGFPVNEKSFCSFKEK